jgi:WD40 repeat protein
VELWDFAANKLLRRLDVPQGSSAGSGVLCDLDSFYLPEETGQRTNPALANLLRRFDWSDGKELSRPEVMNVMPQSEFPGPDPEQVLGQPVNTRSGWDCILWQPCNGIKVHQGQEPLPDARLAQLRGLELQVGWSRRVALADPVFNPGPVGNFSLMFSPSRRYLAMLYSHQVGTNKEMGYPIWEFGTLVWESSSGRLLFELPRNSAVTRPTFDRTERWMALVNAVSGTVDVYNTGDGKLTHRSKLAGLPRQSIDSPLFFEISPGGDRLSFINRGVLYLWDEAADRPVAVVDKPGHFGPVSCVAQHQGAGLIASGGDEGVVLIWDRAPGKFLRTLVGHASEVVALAFHPDGTRLASASADGTVILWEVGGRILWTRPAAQRDIIDRGLVFDPAGSVLLVGASEGELLRLDVASGQVLSQVSTGTDGLAAVALSPEGSSLATASEGGRVTLWEPGLARERSSWEAGAPIGALAFAGSSDFLITGGTMIELREAVTGRVLLRQEPPRPPVRALSVDARTGDLVFADASDAVHLVSLTDLHGAFRDLDLEIPGFPFTSSALLPSKLAEDVLGEPSARPIGQIEPSKMETSQPRGRDQIPRVRSEIEKN